MDINLTAIYVAVQPYFEYAINFLIIPLIVALIKSEKLALDNSTQANGIVHWYKLAKQALALIPAEEIKKLEDKLVPEVAPIIEALTKDETENKENEQQ